MRIVTDVFDATAAYLQVHLFPSQGNEPFATIRITFRDGEGSSHTVRAFCTIPHAEQIVRDLRQALDDLPVAQEPVSTEEAE